MWEIIRNVISPISLSNHFIHYQTFLFHFPKSYLYFLDLNYIYLVYVLSAGNRHIPLDFVPLIILSNKTSPRLFSLSNYPHISLLLIILHSLYKRFEQKWKWKKKKKGRERFWGREDGKTHVIKLKSVITDRLQNSFYFLWSGKAFVFYVW